jgi:hypothetical protein
MADHKLRVAIYLIAKNVEKSLKKTREYYQKEATDAEKYIIMKNVPKC